MLRTSVPIPAALAGFLLACSDPPSDPARTPASIQLSDTVLVLDDGATAQLTATILDRNGQPFSRPPGGFTLSWSSTDANTASVSQTGLVQANRPGPAAIRVTAGSLAAAASVTVRIVASVLQALESSPAAGVVGAVLPDPVTVRVADRHGDGVPGAVVRFSASHGGSFAPDSAVTDAAGIARSHWTLGTTAGAQSAAVSSPGTTPLALGILAVPGQAVTVGVSAASSRVIRNKRVQFTVRALDRYGNQVVSPALEWSSSDPDIATVSAGGLVQTRANGTAEISARIGDARGSASIEVFTVQHETVSPYLSTPAAGYLWEMPVLAIAYLPTADGDTLDVAHDPDFYWLNPVSLERKRNDIELYMHWMKFMLEEGSRFRGHKDPAALPSLGYRIVDWITVFEPTPPNYSKPATSLPWPSWHGFGWMVDFHQIFARLGVRRYVEELGVKEIWFWAGGWDKSFPSYDPRIHKDENLRFSFESNMSSPTGPDISNSDRDPTDLPIYNRTYVVYGAATRRTQAEAIHVHGHQLEAMFSYANWRQDGNVDLFWKQFVGQDQAGNFITGRAGWTHMPPNTTGNYDWYNPTLVASDIEDWRPDNSGVRTMVNVDTWARKDYAWPSSQNVPQKGESQWYIYWMQNMPGRDNDIPRGQHRMTNWWEFVGDWDGAMQRRLGLHTGPAAPGVRSAFSLARPVEPPPRQ
jgi:hypothetical protein